MSTITLTSYGASGHLGPTEASINANGPAHVTGTSQYDGYQIFTVPSTGTYRFELQGAAGGVNTGSGQQGHPSNIYGTRYVIKNGYKRLIGAYVSGEYSLNANDTVVIVVGQGGADSSDAYRNPGGGGGTFVALGTFTNNTLLFAAGGAGGSSYVSSDNPTDNSADGVGQGLNPPVNANGAAATLTSASTNSSGANSGGGASYELNSGGATITFVKGNTVSAFAYSFKNGAVGSKPTASNFAGGFGGGGHGSYAGIDDDKGGGGGYLGGAYAFDAYVCGTGGNSYVHPQALNTTVTAGGSGGNDITSDRHGIVKITQVL